MTDTFNLTLYRQNASKILMRLFSFLAITMLGLSLKAQNTAHDAVWQKAMNGDAESQYLIGKRFDNGDSVTNTEKKSKSGCRMVPDGSK